SRCAARSGLPHRKPERRRLVGRRTVYWNRFSEGVLFEVPPVSTLFPIVRTRALPEDEVRFPLSLTAGMSKYIAGKRIRGVKKFPLVMMLEPLHACNLTCTGCGRIREYADTIREKLTVEQCLNALDECGAPIVSICGGEPFIYPELGRLVEQIIARRKHIYLCTNGMFIRKRLHEFKPTSRLFFNVHLDGLEKTHDMC